MKCKKSGVVQPSPYYQLTFSVSYQDFRKLYSDLYDLSYSINIEFEDHVERICDYEGDLVKIRVYREPDSEKLISAILDYYQIDENLVPNNMDIMLSMV